MMRRVEPTDVVGKTIESIENSSINVLRLKFTDGTSVELWAEDAVYTPAGNIPGIFVDDSTSQAG